MPGAALSGVTVMQQPRDSLACDELLTIVDSITDGVFAVDKNLKLIFLNKAAERITGYSSKEAIGRPCRDILHSNICENSCVLRETMTTGRAVVNRPVCLTNKQGRRIPISISTALLKDERGRVVGGVETFRDLDLVERLRKEFEAKHSFENIVGLSEPMRRLFESLPTIARSESSVLVEGETGAGKELIARALHTLSPRKGGPFVGINCGALPDTLLESELFGYVAGAFTDARKEKKGRFELARQGTIFLDEIGDVSSAMQVKLLRVLQERTFEPLGATTSLHADVRVIAATNKKLDSLVEVGVFRKDLYYRINVIKVVIPPLRERREDIPLLAEHFIGRFNRLRQKDISGLTPPALKLLMNHEFPGNVRELENIIEHAFVLSPGGVIKPEHLPDYLQGSNIVPTVEIAGTMKEMEALFILGSLKRNNWRRDKTAEELGIDTSTLYRKIKKLGLKVPHSEK
jgi:PAS domain S-box-containing protein